MENQHKWWNNPSCSLESFNVCSLFNGSLSKDSNDCCDQCKARFTLLKRKKVCEKCGLIYCKSCLFNLGASRVCRKCKIFNLWPVDKHLVASLRVRDLMYYLQTNRISTNTCKEKNDIVELVLVHLSIRHYRNQPRNDSSNIHQTTNQSSSANVNPARPESQSQSRSYNDEGIRVFPTDGAAQNDNSSLSDWCLVDNLIVEGTVPECRPVENAQQATNIPAHLPDNIGVVEVSHNEETENYEIIEEPTIVAEAGSEPTIADVARTEAETGSEPIDNNALLNEIPTSDEITVNQDAPGNDNQDTSEANALIHDLLSGSSNNLEPPSTGSSSSTPQHSKGSPIDVASIIKLGSLTDEDAVRALSVRQCKEILSLHRVDFSGVTEKYELIARLLILWKDFKERYSDLSSVPDDQICKICMDAPIDCVFLNCGHVIACIFCGKQMAECPICRQNVSRVVRIFKT